MKSSLSFNISNGLLNINNSTVNIKYRKGKYALDILKFFGSISLVIVFIEKLNNYNNIIGFYENLKFWGFALGSLVLFYLLFEFLFKKVWFSKIEISDIAKLIIEDYEDYKEIDEDSKIEITFYTNNKRNKKIEFKKENQKVELLIHEIKKRNTRIEIQYL